MEIKGYCHKCKSSQEMLEVVESLTKTGVPMKKGKCAVCQTTVVTIGPKPKVAKPAKVPKVKVEKPAKKAKKAPIAVVEDEATEDDE